MIRMILLLYIASMLSACSGKDKEQEMLSEKLQVGMEYNDVIEIVEQEFNAKNISGAFSDLYGITSSDTIYRRSVFYKIDNNKVVKLSFETEIDGRNIDELQSVGTLYQIHIGDIVTEKISEKIDWVEVD